MTSVVRVVLPTISQEYSPVSSSRASNVNLELNEVLATVPLCRLVLPSGTLQTKLNCPAPNTPHTKRTVSRYRCVPPPDIVVSTGRNYGNCNFDYYYLRCPAVNAKSNKKTNQPIHALPMVCILAKRPQLCALRMPARLNCVTTPNANNSLGQIIMTGQGLPLQTINIGLLSVRAQFTTSLCGMFAVYRGGLARVSGLYLFQ